MMKQIIKDSINVLRTTAAFFRIADILKSVVRTYHLESPVLNHFSVTNRWMSSDFLQSLRRNVQTCQSALHIFTGQAIEDALMIISSALPIKN